MALSPSQYCNVMRSLLDDVENLYEHKFPYQIEAQVVSVLVFPAGSEVGLEVERSFRYIRNVDVFGASSAKDHSDFAFNRVERLPFVNDDDFIVEFENLVKELDIEYVFPAHDDAIVALSRWGSIGPDRGKPAVISSGYQTDIIARSKRATYNALKTAVAVPMEYQPSEIGVRADRPLFVKPDRGQGSKGTRRIAKNELLGDIPADYLLLEYLPGVEFTVDCFTDRFGALRFAQARERKRTSNGISVSTSQVDRPELQKMAACINDVLSFRGMWFFQAKLRSDGTPALLEIATRVSGNMGYFRAKGVNLPLLALYDRMGKDVEIFANNIDIVRDSALRAKYRVNYVFDSIYIDLDDTLINREFVNAEIIALLYKWQNESKNIYLITRHRAVHGLDPRSTLIKAKINPEIFHEIIEVENSQKKSSKILKGNAIFIDDSHSERQDVHKHCNIPTFDCQQAIEVFN